MVQINTRGLELHDEKHEGIWFVRADGRLDGYSAMAVHAHMEQVLRRGSNQVCFDMSRVQAITSAGSGALLVAHQRAAEQGGRIVFLRPYSGVREVLERLGLLDVLTVVRSRADARQALQS